MIFQTIPFLNVRPSIVRFGRVTEAEEAARRAFPEMERRNEIISKKARLERELAGTDEEKDRVLRTIAKGLIEEDQVVKRFMDEMRGRQDSLRSEIDKLEERLRRLPSLQRVRTRASTAHRFLERTSKLWGGLDRMPFEQKREVLQHVFGGKDLEGRRLGVYVEKTDGEDKKWFFYLRGQFWDWDKVELKSLKRWQKIRRMSEDSSGHGGGPGNINVETKSTMS
jgi:hypothetical protein